MAQPPQLQLALDQSLDQARSVLSQVHSYVDVIEVGTPLIIAEGMAAVRTLRIDYPDHHILADLKIVDAGALEAQLAFEAGASVVTVLGLADDATITAAVQCARDNKGRVMADMLRVNDLISRAGELLQLGVDTLCVHRASDLTHKASVPFGDLQALRERYAGAQLAVAGGIDATALDDILPCRPDVVVVGGAICSASDPQGAAKTIKEKLMSMA